MSVVWKTQKAYVVDSSTSEEIERLNLEVWEGEPVAMSPSGKRAGITAQMIVEYFAAFQRAREGIYYATDGQGFLLARNPDTLLSPDAALYRLRDENPDEPWHHFSPEIAVEVVSPSNTRAQLLAKRDHYLRAGSEQVWIVDPDARSIEVHFQDKRIQIVRGGQLHCSGIAEGLVIDLERVFTPKKLQH